MDEETTRLRRLVAAHEAQKGRGTPAEYMAYMRAKEALGYPLTPGQRGFLQAARAQMSEAIDADR